MDGFNVGVAELQSASQELEAGRTDMHQQGVALGNDFQAVLGTAWKGQAAAAAGTLMARYNDSLQKLFQAADEIKTQMDAAAAGVQAQQDSSVDSISSITNALG